MDISRSSSGKVSWFLIVSILMVFVGGLLAYWVQTDGGKIAVRDTRFMGTDGIMMSGLLYIPQGVTSKKPAPGILAIHGYINSRETQDVFAIEFARRGYVVLALDQTGHGFSDAPAFSNGFGGPDGLRYLRSLDFVDPDNIGIEGHSMGGYATVCAAAKYPDYYKSTVILGSAPGLRGTPEGTPELPHNLRLIYSQYDEFAKFMYNVDMAKDIVNTDKLKKWFGTTDLVQVDKMYGSLEAGTAKQLLMPSNIHTRDHFRNLPIAQAIEWFQMTLKGGEPIPPNDQIWIWKQIGNLIALIGMVLFLFAYGSWLLRTRFFTPIREMEPVCKPFQGAWWWIGALLLVIIPILTFFRFQHLYGVDLVAKVSALFPQAMTTGVMVWAVLNAVISLILFLIWHYADNRKAGATALNYGFTWQSGLEWSKVGRSFLFAGTITIAAYLLLCFSGWLFNMDFRFFVFAVKQMSPLRFQIFLSYFIPFFFYCLILGMVLNGQLRRCERNGKPVGMGQSMIINMALMVIGYIGLLVVQYIPLLSGGTLAIPSEPLLTILGYQFIPLLAIVGLLTTYFYHKTGHIYAGAFLSAMIITWIVVAGQATHFKF